MWIGLSLVPSDVKYFSFIPAVVETLTMRGLNHANNQREGLMHLVHRVNRDQFAPAKGAREIVSVVINNGSADNGLIEHRQ